MAKNGEKLEKMGKSGEKMRKIGKSENSGNSGEKWLTVANSG